MIRTFTSLIFFTLITADGIQAGESEEPVKVDIHGHWDVGDMARYRVHAEDIKLIKNDTQSRDAIAYEAGVSIVGRTDSTMLIEWTYSRFTVVGKSLYHELLSRVLDNYTITVQTDARGKFDSVVHWQVLGEQVVAKMEQTGKTFVHHPDFALATERIRNMYLSREAIIEKTLEDILQWLALYGEEYVLGEPQYSKVFTPNHLGGDPFVADITTALDEVNIPDDYAVIRRWKSVDPKVLTEETYNLLIRLSTETGFPPPARDGFPEFRDETSGFSIFNLGNGWLIYSEELRVLSAADQASVELRILEKI